MLFLFDILDHFSKEIWILTKSGVISIALVLTETSGFKKNAILVRSTERFSAEHLFNCDSEDNILHCRA